MSKAEGGGLRRWIQDLVLGVRLAVGGGRTPWGRISLTSVGAGLGVAVLLLLASVSTAMDQRADRYYERAPAQTLDELAVAPDTEPEPFFAKRAGFDHDGTAYSVVFLDAEGVDRAPPPGLERMPEPGEIFPSPALKELFDAPRGEILQQRLGGQVIDEIEQSGLIDPHERFAYVGTDQLRDTEPLHNATAYGFGIEIPPRDSMQPEILAVLLVGIVAIVMPVIVFVANSTRMAESARDRRLAALRLVGADAGQIRRIASGEALLSAGGGLIVGLIGFLVARSLVEPFRILDVSVFSSDLIPDLRAVIAIVVGLPLVAVATAITAMRRVVVEPLGVVRLSQPIKRRLWWRLALVVIGFVGVIVTRDEIATRTLGAVAFSLSVAALLAGVPALLPWLLDRAVARLRGGPLPWQLAVRRLQLGSGTASRAVSGVAVLLAAMISLYAVINTVEARNQEFEQSVAEADVQLDGRVDPGRYQVLSSATEESTPSSPELLAALETVPGVTSVFSSQVGVVEDSDENWYGIIVADCPRLEMLNTLPSCEPGDAYLLSDSDQTMQLRPGQELDYHDSFEENESMQWRVPEGMKPVPLEPGPFAGITTDTHTLLLTPQAAADLPVESFSSDMYFTVDVGDQATVDAALIALSQVDILVDLWAARDFGFSGPLGIDTESTLDSVVVGLTVVGLLTFALIGSSLLVVAIEQIQERKRPLAVIAAVGAPRRTLSSSVLLQTLVPMMAALLVAVFVGTAIAVAVLLPSGELPVFEWKGMGLMALGALIVPILVTLGTLPSLRRATRPEELRTE